jgi:hypothetical protein
MKAREREVGLRLNLSGAHDQHPALATDPPRFAQQRRLSDPGRTLHDNDRAARANVVQPASDQTRLTFTPDQ